jgi:hypothetical protein
LFSILAVRAVVNIWGRRLMQAWDMQSILGRRCMLQLVKRVLGVHWRTRCRIMLHLRRWEWEGKAILIGLEWIRHCATA